MLFIRNIELVFQIERTCTYFEQSPSINCQSCSHETGCCSHQMDVHEFWNYAEKKLGYVEG